VREPQHAAPALGSLDDYRKRKKERRKKPHARISVNNRNRI
jgi:hypothetical protein